ncbi:cell envelope-related transcriptional attenuator [Cellulomonas flavigena DSM 20109]|uniref:Cell envelope-related transcriptional attenuator n=1 Tax=Cellulomonas flavigena (strain ATCC 482 / DSM 20109 / BCRC 11376 / JCM 18109 / NBRC 3775 / NCIMB 8073 / NRS 134) TaxID=446466 RepID=D5UHF2_CELFN|nr:cell envelope-related transcriptional attenuator [Cellulomonas flavigena DSM 20109]
MLRGIALAVTTVLVFGGSGAMAVAARMTGNVDSIDLGGLVEAVPTPSKEPDPSDAHAGQPVNVLVLGSDQRDGANADIGGVEAGMRSDTTIVVHVSADRTRVEMVSLPRDSLVEVPSCTLTNGKTTKAQRRAMLNSAFQMGWDYGGDLTSAAACTVSTVQANTGLTIDNVVVVDFAGFQNMINAIGGVPMCIERDVYDKYTGLNLTAGEHHLDGITALQYARARHGTGFDGSDTMRAGRQQVLVARVANEVLSKNLLTDAGQLLQFLSAATQSVTTDLTLADLSGLAFSLRTIDRDSITFMTVPWVPATSDPNRVEWTSAADELWANMVADVPMLGVPEAPQAPEPPAASPGTDAGTAPAAPPPPVETPAPAKTPGVDAFTAADAAATC